MSHRNARNILSPPPDVRRHHKTFQEQEQELRRHQQQQQFPAGAGLGRSIFDVHDRRGGRKKPVRGGGGSLFGSYNRRIEEEEEAEERERRRQDLLRQQEEERASVRPRFSIFSAAHGPQRQHRHDQDTVYYDGDDGHGDDYDGDFYGHDRFGQYSREGASSLRRKRIAMFDIFNFYTSLLTLYRALATVASRSWNRMEAMMLTVLFSRPGEDSNRLSSVIVAYVVLATTAVLFALVVKRVCFSGGGGGRGSLTAVLEDEDGDDGPARKTRRRSTIKRKRRVGNGADKASGRTPTSQQERPAGQTPTELVRVKTSTNFPAVRLLDSFSLFGDESHLRESSRTHNLTRRWLNVGYLKAYNSSIQGLFY